MHKRTLVVASIALAAGLVGVALGYELSASHYRSLFASLAPMREQGDPYRLVAPLLSFRVPEASEFGEYTGLKSSMQSAIDRAKSAGVSRGTVYFRDLTTSAWVGISEDDTYTPASLLKVPLLIAYEKQAEKNPGILNARYAFDPAVMHQTSFEATSSLVAWKSYSVEELLEHMIDDSDNGATYTLLAHSDPKFLASVYTALGIPDPKDSSGEYQIGARTYGLFFRILYNATYLSPESSEAALELLSRASFADGLVAGLPSGTTVAHKFGEHVVSTGGVASGIELHDCGIVYYPEHPYLLCVMTSAGSYKDATAVIKQLSAITYQTISKKYPSK